MAQRPISFEQAKAQFVHRFTMEHVPAWTQKPVAFTASPDSPDNGPRYYAPQFRTDKEWYDSTAFPGEGEMASRTHCYTSGQTWPLGQWLPEPFKAS